MEIVFHGGICLDEQVRKFFSSPSDDRRCVSFKDVAGPPGVLSWAPGPFRGNDCSYVYAVAAALFILGALNPLPNMDLLVSPGNQDGSRELLPGMGGKAGTTSSMSGKRRCLALVKGSTFVLFGGYF